MPGRRTTTGTFPRTVVLESDRLGGDVLGAVGTCFGGLLKVEVGVGLTVGGSSPATVSWRSCVQTPSLAGFAVSLINVRLCYSQTKDNAVGMRNNKKQRNDNGPCNVLTGRDVSYLRIVPSTMSPYGLDFVLEDDL